MGSALCRACRQEQAKPVKPFAAHILSNTRTFYISEKPEIWTYLNLEKKDIRKPKLEINRRRKEASIDIEPVINFFEESSYYSDSRQHSDSRQYLQSGLPRPYQLPPAQIQGSSASSVSNGPSGADSSAAAQGIDSSLWDEVFCDEVEFLEEVFRDRCFRALAAENDGAVRLNRVRDYVLFNESWGFSSPEKKHKFVTNVLLLYKAYLPRGEGQPRIQNASWNLGLESSYIDRKITSSALWRWWTNYVEEVSFRYSSMISSGQGVKGVALLVSKLLEDYDYPNYLITQLKPYVAQKIWNQWEAKLSEVKENLNRTFDTVICPNKGDEDPQDFVNKYIVRSFIPLMLGILAEVHWFINNHTLVIKFKNKDGWASQNQINHMQLEPLDECLSYDSEANIYLPTTIDSPQSINAKMKGFSNSSCMSYDTRSGLAEESNKTFSNGNDDTNCQSSPSNRSLTAEDEQKPEFFLEEAYGTIKIIDFSKVDSSSEPLPEIKIRLKDLSD